MMGLVTREPPPRGGGATLRTVRGSAFAARQPKDRAVAHWVSDGLPGTSIRQGEDWKRLPLVILAAQVERLFDIYSDWNTSQSVYCILLKGSGEKVSLIRGRPAQRSEGT
jgi:hypothetical protein